MVLYVLQGKCFSENQMRKQRLASIIERLFSRLKRAQENYGF